MRKLQNTLYVTTEGTYLHKDGETVSVKTDNKEIFRVPVHNLESIVCMGYTGISPYLMNLCMENDVSVSFMTPSGRYLGRVTGHTKGNVLLRKSQYRFSEDIKLSNEIAKPIVAAKITNSRLILSRFMRDHREKSNDAIKKASEKMKSLATKANNSECLDKTRGFEGMAADSYFKVFNQMILSDEIIFNGRNRRPPRDEVNALLSFLYSFLYHDCRCALESAGLDPAVGFLHRDRPGRMSLALDVMEEFRPILADKTVLKLINLKKIQKKDFRYKENGAVILSDNARKTVITEYQNRKKTILKHPFLNEKMELGLAIFVQVRLMASYLRGDIEAYPPFFWGV
jgi:CRISPR-associated protein Cas1